MTDRFFTNAIPASGALVGTERIPADIPAGGSEFLTPAQIAAYVLGIIPTGKYTADSTDLLDFTATPAQISGAMLTAFDLTGNIVADRNMQLPTVAALYAAISWVFPGYNYIFRLGNHDSPSTKSWTIVTNTGWTLNGNMTVQGGDWTDFLIQLTSASAATITNLGGGTV